MRLSLAWYVASRGCERKCRQSSSTHKSTARQRFCPSRPFAKDGSSRSMPHVPRWNAFVFFVLYSSHADMHCPLTRTQMGGAKGGRQNWKKRFFVLKEDSLYYFKEVRL